MHCLLLKHVMLNNKHIFVWQQYDEQGFIVVYIRSYCKVVQNQKGAALTCHIADFGEKSVANG